MLYRKKVLLNFLSDTEYLSSMKLQKMLFLFCQKYENQFYSFLPYKYGGYSFQANHDLYTLEKRYSWVKSNKKNYALTSYQNKSEIELKEKHKVEIEAIKSNWLNKIEYEIIRYTYNKYPYYAIHSQLLDDTNISDLKFFILQYKPLIQKGKKIFTIGYEGRSPEEYFNILIKNNISTLCDVRYNPNSRKYGFSKKIMEHICSQIGIIYQHIPELGIQSNLRKNLHEPEDYARLFKIYKKETLCNSKLFDKVKNITEQFRRVAFTCFEADFHSCHRKPLAEKIGKNSKVELIHL